MSKAIRSYPQGEQAKVAARRAASKTGGLGFLSVLAFLKKKEKEGKGA